MSAEHSCRYCVGWHAGIRECNSEIVNLVRVAEKRPGTLQATNSLARIPVLRERRDETRRLLAAHLAEVAS